MPELDILPPLTDVAARGFRLAAQRLSMLFGWPLRMEDPILALIPLADAVGMFGHPDAAAVSIHARFSGDLSGQLLLLLAPEVAERLAAACVGDEVRAPELTDSFLSEVGNIAGASLVNTLADQFDLTVVISPPEVVADLAGAILGTVLPLAEAAPDTVLMIQTAFRSSGVDVSGLFLLLPDGGTLARLTALISRAANG